MFKEGCRIEVFADELRRRSEENQRNAQSDSTTLSERSTFTGFGNGNIYPILKQNYIFNAEYATPVEIDTYMSALDFEKVDEATFTNGDVIISDLYPRNVLKDKDGDLFVVDAEFKKAAAN